MTSKRQLIITWGLALIPAAITACLYHKLPDFIPMQWGMNGVVRYDAKVNIWLTVGMAPLFALLFPLLRKIDPRSRNYEKFGSAYNSFITVLMLFLMIINFTVLSESFYPGRLSVGKMIPCLVGGLLMFLGNMMPKVKSNFFIGIKNPWTLSNPEVWNRSHRLAGYLFFFGGLLIALFSFILTEFAALVVLLAVVTIITLIPTVMSYIWYRQYPSD